ncbi:MAG: hypothetical protein HHAS10_04960 [Candidatus Altimarinota bacterium]
MLEIRKGTASRGYENSFFREFSYNLAKLFEKHNKDGLLIGFSEVDEAPLLQIDALLITEHVVCIIDFKNYSGKVMLPEESDFQTGAWISEKTGDYIKGGARLSPFDQLFHQKRKLTGLYRDHISKHITLPNIFDPHRVRRIVCFQEIIELVGHIPGNQTNFFGIVDKSNYLEKINDFISIKDESVCLSKDGFDAFKLYFMADAYESKEEYGVGTPSNEKNSTEKSNMQLTDDQKIVLSDIGEFLKSESHIFILSGMTGTGKSFLISDIIDESYRFGYEQVDVLAFSQRVAHSLTNQASGYKVNSLYSYIYSGGLHEKTSDTNNEGDQEDVSIDKELIGVGTNDNADKCVYIIDEAHLISDVLFESDDVRFGTGRLLHDFVDFIKQKPAFKVIFIGDPYLIQDEKSALNGKYIHDSYGFIPTMRELRIQKSKTAISNVTSYLKEKIVGDVYSEMEIPEVVNTIHHLKNDDKNFTIDLLKERMSVENYDTVILAYGNQDVVLKNKWIKKNIFHSGDSININDRVVTMNQMKTTSNDLFASVYKIDKGMMGTITDIKPREEFLIETKSGRKTKLYFRDVSFKGERANSSVNVKILENSLLSEKGDISKDEEQAYHIFLNGLIKEEGGKFEESEEYQKLLKDENYINVVHEIDELSLQKEQGEKVKGKIETKEKEKKRLEKDVKKEFKLSIQYKLRKDPSSKFGKYKNTLRLQYGWAMTVHKTFSFHWETVIFDLKYELGKNNIEYFKWLYTGISRTIKNLYLINYSPISPLDELLIEDAASADKRVKRYIMQVKGGDDIRKEDQIEEFIVFIRKHLDSNYSLKSTEVIGWELHIQFMKGTQLATLAFGFDKKGKFKLPILKNGEKWLFDELNKVLGNIKYNFDDVEDIWKRTIYQKWETASDHNFRIVQIGQNNYQDFIKLYQDEQELDIECRYNGKNQIISIKALYYSDIAIWNKFQEVLNILG